MDVYDYRPVSSWLGLLLFFIVAIVLFANHLPKLHRLVNYHYTTTATCWWLASRHDSFFRVDFIIMLLRHTAITCNIQLLGVQQKKPIRPYVLILYIHESIPVFHRVNIRVGKRINILFVFTITTYSGVWILPQVMVFNNKFRISIRTKTFINIIKSYANVVSTAIANGGFFFL